MKPVAIAIGSAGRRVSLVRWFKEALVKAQIDGTVIVTDANAYAPAMNAADIAVRMPPYSSEAYEPAMLDMVSQYTPEIFLSLNDYELQVLATGLSERIESLGTRTLGLPAENHQIVADKLLMYQSFNNAGIRNPLTVLATERAAVAALSRQANRLIVKHRFGSGSSGAFVCSGDIDANIEKSVASARNGNGILDPRRENVIIQEHVSGTEYGIDIVCPVLTHDPCFPDVLARKKLSMRSGETDSAKTVDGTPFHAMASSIAGLLKPSGLIDVDIIATHDGEQFAIDVNPRFGGGYAFSHAAGADVPSKYINELIGRADSSSFTRYSSNVYGAKYDQVMLARTDIG